MPLTIRGTDVGLIYSLFPKGGFASLKSFQEDKYGQLHSKKFMVGPLECKYNNKDDSALLKSIVSANPRKSLAPLPKGKI